jgi:hypothetical protein
MIDGDLRDRLELVMKRALHDGVNLWDALDKAGLVVTEPQIKKQWAACLEQLAFNVDSQPVTVFVQMGGGQNTPRDAVKGVLAYMDIFQRQFTAQAKD